MSCNNGVAANDSILRAVWKVAGELIALLPDYGATVLEVGKNILVLLVGLGFFVAAPLLVPIVAVLDRRKARRYQAETIALKLEGKPLKVSVV